MDIKEKCVDEDHESELVHVIPSWGPEHVAEGMLCWCHPEPDLTNPFVIVHRRPEDASH